MIVGNEAVLVDPETCQSCGRCCKVFQWMTDTDHAVRLMWTEGEDIKAEDTPFRWDNGVQQKRVTLNKPCIKLEEKDGKFRCKAYNEERPEFCGTYPDHCFTNLEIWEREKIKKTLEYEREICIGLREVTVDDVIEMLKKKRKQ